MTARLHGPSPTALKVAAAIGGILVVVAFYAALMFVRYLDRFHDSNPLPAPISFDQSLWLLESSKSDGTRLAMKDAAASEIQGLSPAEIVEILGEPEETFGSGNWSYLLGPEPGPFGIDSLWLVVEISEGEVFRIRELTD